MPFESAAEARESGPRYCPHPLHAERSERMRLRFYKSETNHFCDAARVAGRVFDLAFGATGGWRWRG